MPTAGVIVAAMAAALVVVGARKTVHGVEKVGHQIGCLAKKAGHKCVAKSKPPATPNK